MDTQQLKAFACVAEQQSFSRAAELLHLSQPAISKRIKGLEQQLEQTLFDRIGHKVHLTAAGSSLLPRALRLLADMADTSTALRNLNQGVSGTLRIATSHHIGLRHLPPMLAEYTRRYPQVLLEFDFLDSEQAFHDIEQGQRELALLTLPERVLGPVSTQVIWREVLRPCALKQHPLFQLAQCTPADLAAHRAVLLHRHTFTQQRLQALLQKHQVHLQTTTSSSYLEAIAMLVQAGQGWAWLPEVMIEGDLQVLPIAPALSLPRELGLAFHQARTLSKAAIAMRELLVEMSDTGTAKRVS